MTARRLLSSAILFLLLAMPVAAIPGRIPRAHQGVIDLRDWNFERPEPLRLDGEWEFYWQQLLPATPNVPIGPTAQRSGFVQVPDYWNGFELDGERLSGTGYATYRLRVLLPPGAGELALKVMNIHTAYELYVDGELRAAAGTVGTSRSETVPSFSTQVAEFLAKSGELEILIHVANYHHRNGGIWEGIALGSERVVRARVDRGRLFELFLAATILVTALHHLILFALRRRDGAALDFGIFCLVICVRTLVTGELLLMYLVPTLPWNLLMRLEYGSFYLSLPFFVMYLGSIFPDDARRGVERLVQAVGGAFMLLVLLTPPRVFVYSVQPFQIVTLATGGYALTILILAARRRRVGSRILLGGFLVLFAAVINDVLHANQVVHTGFVLPVGLLFFLISQSYLIARRQAIAFETVEQQSASLRTEVAERTHLQQRLVETHNQLELARVGMILGLAKLAESRDHDTGDHLERIREYCRVLAAELAGEPGYLGYISTAYIEDLYLSSILHDIGKVGVPDSILLKPGKLTADEFRIMQQHTVLGGNTIKDVEAGIKVQSFLTLAKEIAYCHHEKWDGSGYPAGLSGTGIPLSARIVAVADVYDALTSARPYKAAFPHDQARTIIVEGRGSHFDPDVVDAFIRTEGRCDEIRQAFSSR